MNKAPKRRDGAGAAEQTVAAEAAQSDGRRTAPAIRRARGDVATEARVLTDARGRVTGRSTGDVVQTVLRRYRARREINERQFIAGLKLQDTWLRSQKELRVTSELGEPAHNGGASGNRAEAIVRVRAEAAQAKRDLERALNALSARLRPVLLVCAVQDRAAADWAHDIGWPPGHGLPVLKIALDSLADYYGVS